MAAKKALNVEIGYRVQTSRERAGLTQEQLAEKINRSTQFVSTLERGAAGASLETIINLCDALKVSSEWLLRGRDAAPDAARIAMKLTTLSEQQLAIVDRMTDNMIDLLRITTEEKEP